MDEKCIGNTWNLVYTVCHRYSLSYRLDSVDADICSVEFAENILVFLAPTERDSLLAPKNRGLLHRRATCFVLNWRKHGEFHRLNGASISDLDEIAFSLSSESLDLCAQTYNNYRRDVLHQAIAKLPLKQQQCVVRYWFEQETDRKIALVLVMTPSAVRKNLQRAREKLPEILKQMGVTEGDLL